MVFYAPSLMTLLGVAFCLTVFYALYAWRFSRETFWQANRIYLLLVPFLAWLIPHLRVFVQVDEGAGERLDPGLVALLMQWQQVTDQISVPDRHPTGQWSSLQFGQILMAVYLAGFLWHTLRTCWYSIRLYLLARRYASQDFGNWTLVSDSPLAGPASFFHFVFSSSREPLPDMVLQHELVHVRQRHSLDILLMELWVALHWYNPLIYRLRAQLRITHEYIADAEVVGARSEGAYAYARLLLHQPQNGFSMLQNTFSAQIASRLRMLARKPSSPWRMAVRAVSLPLGAGLLLFFSVQVIEATPLSSAIEPLAQAIESVEGAHLFPDPASPPIPESPLQTSPEPNPEQGVKSRLFRELLPLERRFKTLNHSAMLRDTLPPPGHKEKSLFELDSNMIRISNKEAISPNKPLYVIDGVVMGKGEEGIISLNPNDIKSITVFKGEKAIAAYGEEGADGVIDITTKKGAAGKNRIPDPGKPGKSRVEVDIRNSSEKNDSNRTSIAGNIQQDGEPKDRLAFSLMQIAVHGEIIGEIEDPVWGNSGRKETLIIKELDHIRITRGKEALEEFGPRGERGVIVLEFPERKEAVKAYQFFKKRN